MKEEVRDILLPYVILYIGASIPVRTELGRGMLGGPTALISC